MPSKKLDDKQKNFHLFKMLHTQKQLNFLWKLFTCGVAKCSRVLWKLLIKNGCKFIPEWPIIAAKSKITHQSTAFPIARVDCWRVALLDCKNSVD